MTEQDAIAHLESRVGHREVTNINPGDIEAWIGRARHRVTEKHARGPHRADFQVSDVELLLVDGVVDIPNDILPGYITRITSESFSTPFELKKNRTEFSYMLCREFPVAAIEGQQIFAEGTDPATPLNEEVLVTGIRVPPLDEWQAKYDDDLIDELVIVFNERPKQPAA